MKIEGAVALVVGADSGLGAALARALWARGAARVHAVAQKTVGAPQAGAVPLVLDLSQQQQADALVQERSDVNLLVNCLVAFERNASSLAGADVLMPGAQARPVGRTLRLIDSFAPVLAAHGGGAVVNVVSVRGVNRASGESRPKVARGSVDWSLSEGLRERLAAQRTQLVYFRARLAAGVDEQVADAQGALEAHVAMRVLDQLEDGRDLVSALRRRWSRQMWAPFTRDGQETSE